MPVSTIKNPQFYLKPLENPPEWTEEEKKIIAWSIEWEGCIALIRSRRKRKGKDDLIFVSPLVAIVNVNLNRLKRFHSMIKLGHIYKRKEEKNKQTSYVWRINTVNEVDYLLTEIEPYLLEKREQSLAVLSFLKSRKERGIERKEKLPIIEKELRFAEKVKKLNRRGKMIQ